jgi:hypothetical protein
MKFDLHYLLCHIRFGYNDVVNAKNGNSAGVDCGYIDYGGQTTGDVTCSSAEPCSDGATSGTVECTADAPCDVYYPDCDACAPFFGCSGFDVTHAAYGFDAYYGGGTPMSCPYDRMGLVTNGDMPSLSQTYG